MNVHPCISVWILGDQLLADASGPARGREGRRARQHPRSAMIESRSRTARMNYHRKKLTLLFSAMRHYAQELTEEGYEVDYRVEDTFADALKAHVQEHAPARIYTMAASAYGGRRFQTEELEALARTQVTVVPNTQFLTGQHDPYPDPVPGKRYVMEHFYRKMRRHYGLLLESDGSPAGGQWNFDKQNRKPLPKDIQPPPIPHFPIDDNHGHRDGGDTSFGYRIWRH